MPKSGGGLVNFIRADGTWAAPGGGLTYYPLPDGLYAGSVFDINNLATAGLDFAIVAAAFGGKLPKIISTSVNFTSNAMAAGFNYSFSVQAGGFAQAATGPQLLLNEVSYFFDTATLTPVFAATATLIGAPLYGWADANQAVIQLMPYQLVTLYLSGANIPNALTITNCTLNGFWA